MTSYIPTTEDDSQQYRVQSIAVDRLEDVRDELGRHVSLKITPYKGGYYIHKLMDAPRKLVETRVPLKPTYAWVIRNAIGNLAKESGVALEEVEVFINPHLYPHGFIHAMDSDPVNPTDKISVLVAHEEKLKPSMGGRKKRRKSYRKSNRSSKKSPRRTRRTSRSGSKNKRR